MTVRGRQGLGVALVVSWLNDDVSTDVTNLEISITPSGGGAAVVGPTSVDIEHIETGVYVYVWLVPDDQTLGDYVVVWRADAWAGPPDTQTQTDTVEIVATYGDSYVTVDQVKDAMQITKHDKDNLIALAVVAASRAVDNRCGRSFFRGAAATTVTVDTAGRLLRSGTGYTLIIGDVATADDFECSAAESSALRPVDAFARGWPATDLLLTRHPGASLEITRVPGWPAIPGDVEQAALLTSMRLVRRPGSPEGVAGSAEWGLIRIPNLDPDVKALLEPYRLPGMA